MNTVFAVRRAMRGAFIASLASLSTLSQAAEDPDVLVTASRVPETTQDTMWSSTILTREDIQARQAQSVEDLLGDQAGVSTDNAGGLGKVSSLFLRGTNADQTLVLIDGVRVASATAGTAPIELIPMDQIDRVEIVRGPRSTLYGSDAMGGVIQIFTRRAGDPGMTFGSSVTGGSHSTWDVTGNLQARGEQAWVSLGAENLTTQGINACLPGAALAGAGCFTTEPDLDGYRSHSGSLGAGVKLTDQLSLEGHMLTSSGQTYFDGDFGNREVFSEQVYSLKLDDALTDTWHLRVAAGRNNDIQKNYENLDPAGNFDTTRDTASAQVDGWLIGNGSGRGAPGLRLIGGIDYQQDRVGGDTAYVESSRWTKGVFSELRGELGDWSGLIGARSEKNEQFGNHVTGDAGLARRINDHLRLTATWGTAFHAPTFNDLYYPGFGNPTLDPEKSRSFELGADGSAGRLRWSLHAYETHVDNLIAFDSTTFLPQNIDRARIRGAELQADWRNQDWKVGGQLTRLDPSNLGTGGAADLQLPRRPKESGSLEVRKLFPTASVATVVRWEGRRFDDLANTAPLGGYYTVDLVGEWQIVHDWQIQAGLHNLLDRDYQTAAFFAQDGFHFSLTVRYQPTGK